MDITSIRAIATLAVAFLLFNQFRASQRGTRRQQAFGTGALAFLLIGGINSLQALGVDSGAIGGAVLLAALLLLSASLALLVLAWRAGELQRQIEQARDRIAQERDKKR